MYPCLLSSHLTHVCSIPLVSLGPSFCCQVLEVQASGTSLWDLGGGGGALVKAIIIGLCKVGVFSCLICCSLLSIVNEMLCQCIHSLEIKCTGVLLYYITLHYITLHYSTMSELTLDTSTVLFLNSQSHTCPHSLASPFGWQNSTKCMLTTSGIVGLLVCRY